MQNKNSLILLGIVVLVLSVGSYFYFRSNEGEVIVDVSISGANSNNNGNVSTSTNIVYKNTEYGFNFTLPASWKGYTVVNNKWIGSSSTITIATNTQTGPKLLIRNPKWTATAPYEDIPVLVFTITQWNVYLAEKFNISAAPIQASELARNDKYVFALPPRWDYDYSIGFKEAQDILASKPLQAFNSYY